MTRSQHESLDDDELLALPKVELHVHLEGSIPLDVLTSLSATPDAALSRMALEPGGFPRSFSDFARFVDLYLAISRSIRTPDDLATVAAAFAREQARQNIVWTEVTFTALTHVGFGMEPVAMWAALRDGLRAGEPVARVGVIVDAVRNLGPEHAHATVRLVEVADAPIVGFGLAGDELARPARDFAVLRTAADRLGLGLAVHAGETGGPQEVRDALDDLGADRIGHGVGGVGDRDLVERLARDRTPLEVCPSSNVALGIAPSLDAHPFGALWAAGAYVTVNSDDPALFATSLTEELGHAVRTARLSRDDTIELQRRAALAAFLPPNERTRLVAAVATAR